MERHGVKRLICITGLGAGDSKGHGGFLYDKLILPLILQRIYDDKDRQEAEIRQIKLDWTIVGSINRRSCQRALPSDN